MKEIFSLFREAAWIWYDRDADSLAATVSYYALFAIVPLLLLTVTFSSLLYGKELVIATFDNWGGVLGAEVIGLLHAAVINLGKLSDGFGIPIFGALFFTGMVIVLLNTFTAGLNHIWDIPHRGFKGWLVKCGHSMLFVVGLEVYLLLLIGLDRIFSIVLGHDFVIVHILEAALFMFTTALLFSFTFQLLPWECPSFKARLLGGLVASVLFTTAKIPVMWYVSVTPIPSLFGAAGLIVILLIWVFVSTSVIYYGAAFAKVVDNKKNLC